MYFHVLPRFSSAKQWFKIGIVDYGFLVVFKYTCKLYTNIVAAFRGMHDIVSPAKHSYAWLPRKCDYWTDAWTDRQTDRRRTKWSLCAAMLRRRQKNENGPLHLAKYTRAPQTVHNTPVMNILKGHFYIIFFFKKPTSNFKFQLNLSMHVGGTCRKWMDRQIARRTWSDDTQTWSIVH